MIALEIGQIISLIGVAASLFYNAKNSKRVDTQDVEVRAIETTRSMTKMEINIEQMTKSMQQLVEDLVDTKEQLADHNLRLTIAESGLKDTAREVNDIHNKVEKLGEKITKLEG